MSVVNSEKRIKMIEEVISTKEKSKLGHNKKNKQNDLNTQMIKTPDFKRSISLQTSKKKDQKATFEENNDIPRGGVTTIADIAFATLNSAKKAGLKGNARTLIWIHSLREKAIAIESMLHTLQSLTIALKRKQQLGCSSKKNNYSAIAVAAVLAASKPINTTTSFSSSMESSASTKSSGNDGGSVPAVSDIERDNVQNEHTDIRNATDEIAQQIAELEETVKAMRATLFLVCRGRLLEKQIGLLLSIQSQMYPTFDISVRFFGIDWPHLFRISQSLIQRVELLSETLLGTTTENLPASGTSNIRPQVESNPTRTLDNTKKPSNLSNPSPLAVDAIKSTNVNFKTSKKDSSATDDPQLRLPISKSEPHMGHGLNRRAWPAATTVLAQVASSGKAKNRYIDILIPSNILRDLATIEADVTSHLEAVLRERLSKINRDRILQKQRFYENRNEFKKIERGSIRGIKSAGGRFSFHPFNQIRITPGTSNNNTPKKNDLAPAGSESNVIEGTKTAENGLSLEASLATISNTPKLVHSKSTGNLLGGKMRRIKEAFSFGSNRGLHNRHLNNDNLWGAWYSGLQTVAFMPSQFPHVNEPHPSSLPLKRVEAQLYSVKQGKTQVGCEDNHMIETDSQTDGSTSELIRQQQALILPRDGDNNCNTRTSEMRGARPKSTHYRYNVHVLPNSSASTPFHSSTSAGGTVVSSSPSRKRGKSCDRMDNGSVTFADAQTRSRPRIPKMMAPQQHDFLWNDISMSFDSTGTEETTSSSGAAESRNYYHSGHRILPSRYTQPHGKRQPLPETNIFNEFLEEKMDSGISSGPRDELPIDEKYKSSTLPDSTSSELQGLEMDPECASESKELGKRWKLQRSVRVTDDEFTPRKKSKALSREEESFDFDTEDDDDKAATDSGNAETRLIIDHNTGRRIKVVHKNNFSSISPGSFDGLNDDEGDVAYIDDDVDERDLHGDLLNWLTLSDAPRQGHEEHDL